MSTDSKSEHQLFAELASPETRGLVFLKRAFLAVIVFHLLIGLVSSYRAWFQIHSVNLKASENVIHEGSIMQTSVVSYGRTSVDVTMELIQGGSVVALDQQRVRPNEFGFYDPRHTVALIHCRAQAGTTRATFKMDWQYCGPLRWAGHNGRVCRHHSYVSCRS